jgi:hypothetical protein
MAIRYCGDVEVRILFTHGRYRGAVRAPGFKARGDLTPQDAKVRSASKTSPEAYDAAAQSFLRAAMAICEQQRLRLPIAVEGKTLVIRRTFQCPCPVR